MQSFTSEIDPINRIIFKKLILNKQIKKRRGISSNFFDNKLF